MTGICKLESCNKEFVKSDSRQKFCTRSCATIYNNTGRIYSDETKEKLRRPRKSNHKEHEYICEKCKNSFKLKYAIRKGRNIHCVNCKRYTYNIEKPESILKLSKRTMCKIIRRLSIGCSLCGYDRCIGDIHHIISKKKGGGDLHDNLTYVCTRCHREAHNGLITEFITLAEQISDDWLKVYYNKNNGRVV